MSERVYKTTEKQRETSNAYYVANKERISARYKAFSDEVKEVRRAGRRAWRERNKARHTRACQQWATENPEKMKAIRRTSARKSRAKPKNKVINNLRRRLRAYVRMKIGSKTSLFGCTATELRAWIESQFKRGMTWENYGDWHIDHIMPCAAFDLTKPQQVHICFNWQNLRPLWAKDNMDKGDAITHPQLCIPISV